jgi:hypothetical chaperone protein
MIVGMDFGTTNSGMAVYDGRQVHLLPLDPSNANPRVIRTALYVTNDQTVTVGREAVNRYFEQNSGRPVKMQRIWVGEIEVYAEDMYYVTDVYVWVDALSPGRLFLSIKSALRDSDYLGTVIGSFFYPLEDLVALYLTAIRLRAERLLERPLSHVVLGRPVRFAADPQADALAQERLLTAAFRAGYEKVTFQYEPVAAAYHYAAIAREPQNILIFDFGGGTLDITIMRLDGSQERQVLATGGIPVAGDVFDQKLVRARLPPHFGEGSRYGARGRDLPVPKWIFDIFSNWQTVLELQTPENRQLLQEIAQTARKPRQIQALISLAANNYTLQMFDLAEQAKRDLSQRIGAMIHLQGPGFNVYEMVTRSEFEQIIHEETQAIENHLLETVRASGLAPNQIDAVIRTGGSSQIPVFQEMLQRHFGREKVQSIDTFSSVTAGLGIYAHALEAGQVEARTYTADEQRVSRRSPAEAQVLPVNLELMQRRLALQEGRAAGEQVAELALLLVNGKGELSVASFPGQNAKEAELVPLPALEGDIESRPLAALPARPDEPLLLATSHYRFFLLSLRQLTELGELGLALGNFLHFRAHEQVCALNRWLPLKKREKLVLVTTKGYARAYPIENLGETIEGPAPLQFDQPLPGVPLAIFGADIEQEIVVVLDNSRAARWPLRELPLQGAQAINRRPEETVAAALPVAPGAELLMITATGYGQRLPAAAIPVPARPNSRGRVMLSRRDVRGTAVVEAGEIVWLITSHGIRPLAVAELPAEDGSSTRATRAVRLAPGEEVFAVVAQDSMI